MKKIIFILLLLIPVYCDLLCAQSAKSVSILGDSYSTFEGFIPEGNYCWYNLNPDEDHTDGEALTQTWWHKFIKENGYKLEKNNSFSGATICNTGYEKADYSDRSFITRMKDLGSPDIIYIFGGTNDSWANSPIGDYKYENQTAEELYSFRPAMSYLLSHMKDYYPNVEIIFMMNTELKPEISESINEICNHYDIPILELKDIHKQSGHPSVAGMSQISEQVKAFMNQYK